MRAKSTQKRLEKVKQYHADRNNVQSFFKSVRHNIVHHDFEIERSTHTENCINERGEKNVKQQLFLRQKQFKKA